MFFFGADNKKSIVFFSFSQFRYSVFVADQIFTIFISSIDTNVLQRTQGISRTHTHSIILPRRTPNADVFSELAFGKQMPFKTDKYSIQCKTRDVCRALHATFHCQIKVEEKKK